MTTMSEPVILPVAEVGPDVLEPAILRTLAYADVFDFALSEPELHRYLVRRSASLAEISEALGALEARVVRRDGLVALAGREHLFDLRRERRRTAARTWPAAVRYAQAVGSVPFVRMVAVTGALAVGNAIEGADIDLLVVTEPGRLWLGRAGTIAIVRIAAGEGRELCPNYFLAAHALEMDTRDLYGAHEMAQMVPVVGHGLYHRLRAVNAWTADLLPNALGAPYGDRTRRHPVLGRPRVTAEAILRTPLGGALEAWEQRKIGRYSAQAVARGVAGEASFTPDWCKGHLHGHGQHIRASYEGRVRELGVDPLW